jgi:hypothetical protein
MQTSSVKIEILIEILKWNDIQKYKESNVLWTEHFLLFRKKNSLSTSRETYFISITNTKHTMLFREK